MRANLPTMYPLNCGQGDAVTLNAATDYQPRHDVETMPFPSSPSDFYARQWAARKLDDAVYDRRYRMTRDHHGQHRAER